MLEITIINDIFEDEKKLVVVFNDVTSISRLKYLEEISEHKSKLISSVSHELRTPLNYSMNMKELTMLEPDILVSEHIKETLLKPALFS